MTVLLRKLLLACIRLFLSAHVLAQSTIGILIITTFLSAQVRGARAHRAALGAASPRARTAMATRAER